MAAAFKRFPIPEFDRDALKDMAWQPPQLLSEAEGEHLAQARLKGDTSSIGCHPIMPGEALFEKLALRGEHRHALLCLLPDQPVTVFGRSFAWPIQQAWILDSIAPDNVSTIAAWKTPRPMNTRLGPDNGITLSQKVVYALCGHRYGDHWIGNRTLIQNDWRRAGATGGFAILSASDPEINNFHDCNLYFSW